jgi:hypothetical protein
MGANGFSAGALNLPGGAIVLTATKGEPVFWKRSFDGIDALVAERGSALLATAVLLTGSRAAGEDLLQGRWSG